ncbi:hypothetical protein ACFL2K_00725 [Candidatus Margulisiibacteriota bacterium]
MKILNKLMILFLLCIIIFLTSCANMLDLNVGNSSTNYYQDLEDIAKNIQKTSAIIKQNDSLTNSQQENELQTASTLYNSCGDYTDIVDGWQEDCFWESDEEYEEFVSANPDIDATNFIKRFDSSIRIKNEAGVVITSEFMESENIITNDIKTIFYIEWIHKIIFFSGIVIERDLSGTILIENNKSTVEFNGEMVVINETGDFELLNFNEFHYTSNYDLVSKTSTENITSEIETEKYSGNWKYKSFLDFKKFLPEDEIEDQNIIAGLFFLGLGNDILNESEIYETKDKKEKKIGKIKFKNNFKDFDIELDEG